ncbi:hypothetical protein SNE35_05730 [Paucibacter sp. R3-3]|uniref:Uncharacterized protein n=1 Tax=Roseateles agri TaxID=3098619 RepID=A0ABU5DCI7_9BURK|nr:hypothetical protein [Paucibacter sp. R3-3]MDY0743992.1 hypothetical protein [Paucibacter sp. R3-3]
MAGADSVPAASTLTLEQVFRAQPYKGESAKDAQFSRSGRYLAYRWNSFGEPGTDLYVHDTKTGKTLRVTTPAVMARFDAPEDIERFERKFKQKQDETAQRQAKEVAQQAYLRGDAVDMDQWENAGIKRVKKEIAEKSSAAHGRPAPSSARLR